MRDALSLTDQAIAFGGGQLTEAQVLGMLGATPRAQALDLLDALAVADAAALVAGVDGLRAAGHGAVGALDELARWLQLIALAQAAPQALDGQDPDSPEALRLAAVWPADTLQLAYALLLQGRAELSLSPDEHAGLLMILLRVLAFRPAGDPPPSSAALRRSPEIARLTVQVPVPAVTPVVIPAEAANSPRRIEPVAPVSPARPVTPVHPGPAPRPPAPGATPAPTPAPTPTPAAAPRAAADEPPPWLDLPPEDESAAASGADFDAADLGAPVVAEVTAEPDAPPAPAPALEATGLQPTALGQEWAELFAQLKVTAMARTLGLQAQCLRLQRAAAAWQVQLQVSSEALRMAPGPTKLEAALAELAGVAVQLEVTIGAVVDSPALREMEAQRQRQLGAESRLAASPELAAFKRHFETTRIVPGTLRPTTEN